MRIMQFHFKNPRFALSAPEEVLVRLISWATYAILTALAVWLLFFSLSMPLFWLGIVFALFLFDRLLHIGKPVRSLHEVTHRSLLWRRVFGARTSVNLATMLAPSAERLLVRAYHAALRRKIDFGAAVVTLSLPRRDVREIVTRTGVSYDAFREGVSSLEGVLETVPSREEVREVMGVLVRAGYDIAVRSGEDAIEVRDLFAAVLLRDTAEMKNFLSGFAAVASDFEEAIAFGRYRIRLRRFRHIPASLGGFAAGRRRDKHRVMNRSWTARPTPTLDMYGTDLTHLARREQLGFLVGHEDEFSKLLDVVSRPGKPNVLLVGEPGVGKSELVHYLAFRIIKDQVPRVLFDRRLVSLQIGGLLAGDGETDVGERLKMITDEILTAGNVVLFVPDMHNLFKSAGAGARTPLDYFLPIIKGGLIPVIGETYPREFKRYVEPRSDFLDQFEVVRVGEMSEDEATRYLVYHAIIMERQFGVTIVLRAIRKAVEIAARYFREKPLPASGSDLLRECFAQASRRQVKLLDEELVASIAEEKLNIPIRAAEGDEVEKLLNLEDIIHERLVNQDEAVKAVSNALREYRSGLSRRGGPIATFLFVGPTGVGKTELAKILTGIQFGSRDMIHRFDMSEYQDRQSIFRLVGTPDGEKTGSLTDAVRERPYGLILLDEFEKAHADVLNIFLQVFDDGRLTDSLGRTVDFQHSIIVATSNAHSDFIKTEIEAGRSVPDLAHELKRKLASLFRPELINRFSDIIVFRDLTVEEIAQIARILMRGVSKLLDESHGIELTVTNAAITQIAEKGYSKVFGARPLRKVISQEVRGRLADMLLRKEIKRGGTVKIDFNGEKFVFGVTG